MLIGRNLRKFGKTKLECLLYIFNNDNVLSVNDHSRPESIMSRTVLVITHMLDTQIPLLALFFYQIVNTRSNVLTQRPPSNIFFSKYKFKKYRIHVYHLNIYSKSDLVDIPCQLKNQ